MMIFLTGDNHYAIKTEIDRLKGSFIKDHGDAGLEQYSAEDLPLDRLADLTSGGSLFSDKRLLIIRDIGANKELAEQIAQKANEIDSSTTLVLSQAQPDKRTRWYKELQPFAKNLMNLRGPALSRWLIEESDRRGGGLSAVNAAYLIKRVGEDQWRLASELDKLLMHDSQIDTELIDQLVEPASDETIFQLIDLVVGGKVEPALKLYQRLRLGEIDPHQFLGTMAWQLNALFVVKTARTKPAGQIASTAGLSPFVVDRLKPLASQLRMVQIRDMMGLVLEADFDMKQTGIDADQRARLLIAQMGELISSPPPS